jgi:hypothetical protein
MIPTTDGSTITLTAGATPDTPALLQCISTTDGQRTLGVRLAPDGNDNAEFTYRIQQARKMSQRIRAAPLGRKHIRIGFRAIWKMMIQYPLGATCFTSQQCQRLQAKYLPTFLSKMGINRTTATAVRHGPLQLGGMDVFNLETEQGVTHTNLVISHLRKNDEVGQMLHISIDHLQLQAGVSWPVLSQPGHIQRRYVDPCYMANTWEFLDSTHSHLQLELPPLLLPQRQGDSFLMETFATFPDITPTQLIHAQRCRLHLGITTVADICTSNGIDIDGWALIGRSKTRSPVLHFPRQTSPSPPVWKTWHTLLRRCYSTQRAGKLDVPLGPWHRGQLSQVWDTVIDPTTSLIYIWQANRVRIYEKHGRSQKQYQHLRPHSTNSFPYGCLPVSGEFQSGKFVISGYSHWSSTPTQPSTTRQMLHVLNRGVKSNLPLATVAQAIWDGNAIMGTDGSVKENAATYSWVLSISMTNIHTDVCGGGYLPPPAKYTNHYSKRPKAAAIYAGLNWIHDLLKRFPNSNPIAGSTPTFPVLVDNTSVINDIHGNINNLTPTFHFLRADFDIIQGICTLCDRLPLIIDVSHVKSHQDQSTPFAQLTPDAKLNVLADKNSNCIHTKRSSRTGNFPTWVPGTRAALYRGSQQITKNLPAYLRTAAHAPDMQEYLIRRSHEGHFRLNCLATLGRCFPQAITWTTHPTIQVHE